MTNNYAYLLKTHYIKFIEFINCYGQKEQDT